jgi:hypothetical protein
LSWLAFACWACINRTSGNVGARARLIVRSKRVEIDALRLIWLAVLLNPIAAVHMHQGLHAAGIEVIDMLMAQRHR